MVLHVHYMKIQEVLQPCNNCIKSRGFKEKMPIESFYWIVVSTKANIKAALDCKYNLGTYSEIVLCKQKKYSKLNFSTVHVYVHYRSCTTSISLAFPRHHDLSFYLIKSKLSRTHVYM